MAVVCQKVTCFVQGAQLLEWLRNYQLIKRNRLRGVRINHFIYKKNSPRIAGSKRPDLISSVGGGSSGHYYPDIGSEAHTASRPTGIRYSSGTQTFSVHGARNVSAIFLRRPKTNTNALHFSLLSN